MAFNEKIVLNLLGAYIEVQCAYKACADGILNYFSQFITTKWRSPDIIIECSLEQAERKLFRAVDLEKALDGINIYLSNGENIKEWKYNSPLLPPYNLKPYKDRFVGLHAAAIHFNARGAVIIAGERGSGKSTTAIHIVNNSSSCSLITDETVHIYKRSLCIEPFPIALHVFEQKRADTKLLVKKSVKAEETCNAIRNVPSSITNLIFLEKSIDRIRPEIKKISSEEALRLLFLHHVDLGCNKDDAVHTLFYLAHQIPAIKYTYSNYDDLLEFHHALPGLVLG